MSLRAKLLTAIVFVNLLVLAVLFSFLQNENRRVLSEAGESFRRAFTTEVLRGFVERTRRVTIEPILEYKAFDALCRDALVVNNPGATEEGDRDPFIQVNPLGAHHRDPSSFPRSEIIDGITRAMEQRDTLPMHGGYCVPFETGDGRIIGGGWFLPQISVEPSFPSERILIAIGVGALLLAGILFFGMERWVLQPLDHLTEASRALERGELGRQVPVRGGSREIDGLLHTFNRASRELEQHGAELARAVDEATERARRRERELILSQRLAALGTLAAGIAHEINNPLGGMINAVNRLKKKGADPVYVELLEEGLDRIRQIVRRTLDFAPKASEPVTFRVDRAIERARALVAHRVETAGVRLAYLACDGDAVRGDPHDLSQVLLNVLLNSLDALEEGLTAEPRIEITVTVEGESDHAVVRVEIADNGPGADAETLDRMFDPFFSTKGATSTSEKLSSGLGMSISYSIVEQHGGVMRVASPEDGGFVVVIELPGAAGTDS